jgi:two-component system, NtrC family, sensor kinase
MDNPGYSLTIINGTGPPKIFNLATVTQIGRSPENEIGLAEKNVSRSHAIIKFENGSWRIFDLNSSNGTRVNGRTVDHCELRHNDTVQIGSTIFRFENRARLDEKSELHTLDVSLNESTLLLEQIVDSISILGDFSALLRSNEPDAVKLQKMLNDLTVFYSAAVISNRAESIEQMGAQILEYLFEWIGADRGCVFLFDKNSNHLNPVASRATNALSAENGIQISRTILNHAIDHDCGLLSTSPRTDARFESGHSIAQFGITAAICTPMRGRYGRVGCIYFDQLANVAHGKQKPEFTNRKLQFLVAIANQVAIAIEDTRLYHDVIVNERMRAMGEATARVTHELRNVLHGIQANHANMHLIIEGLNHGDAIKSCTDMGKRIDRLSALVNDMLVFIKTDPPAHSQFNLHQALEQIVNEAIVQANQMGIELKYQTASAGANVLGHQRGVEQVLENLLSNAFAACQTSHKPVVSVQLIPSDNPNGYRISVTDNGPGIAPDLHDRVFDAFFTTKNSGIGLGLSNARKIIHQHQGTIEIDSLYTDGTRFNVFLPASPMATWHSD